MDRSTAFWGRVVRPDIGDLEPGIHMVWVIAIDAEWRVGGYTWTFTVV